MTDGLIVAGAGFLLVLVGLIKPIINLNTNIVKLNTTLQTFQANYKENHEKLEGRVNKHGEEIDKINIDIANHDMRIKNIEKEVK